MKLLRRIIRMEPVAGQPPAGALDRLAPFAQEAAKQAGFSKSPAPVRGLEMHPTKGWQAVYRWPRVIVRITVQTFEQEVEPLP